MTLTMCDVPKILIADSEEGTITFNARNATNLIDGSVADKFIETKNFGWLPQTIFDMIDELKRANGMKEYWVAYQAMMNERNPERRKAFYDVVIELINKMPFPILAIDTITSMQKLSNAAALYEYNLGVKEGSRKSDITKADEWGGTNHIRRKFNEIKLFIETFGAPFIQYHGHVAPRKKIMKKSEEDIAGVDIALSGLQSVTFTAFAQVVGTMYRDDKGCWLDFTKKDESDTGSRVLALSNRKLKIADIVKDDDLRKGIRPKTYWSEIYPEIDALKGR